MGKLHYDETRITDAMNRILERTKRMDLSWDWPCGVAYYGLAEAYEVTKNEAYLEFLKERVDELMELGLPVLTVNTCAMGHCLITLYEATGEEKYMDVIRLKTRYLTEEALRFGDHVLQHTVSADNDFPEQCWADTLFMAAFFLLRVGVMTKDEAMIKDALNQYYWHIQYLQDEDTGLWYHGYNNITKDHMSGFYWLWRTILNDDESYEEVSASAGIAASMAIKRNPLHIKYVERSIEGVLSHVAADGRVTDVSGGTAVMKDREGYRNISKKWIQGWGQGMALAFFCAVLDYDKIAGDGAL